MTHPAVEVAHLRIQFPGSQAPAVSDVSFHIDAGECLALVGESGSGKSLTALSLLGLVPPGADQRVESLRVAGVDTRGFSPLQWRSLRGTRVGLVSQDALVSLDPLRRIEEEVAEVLEITRPKLSREERSLRVTRALEMAAMPDPEYRRRQYPHELSGGMRQRALIASALAGNPEVLIADEPTTALDSLTQSHILDLLSSLKRSGLALLLVSHDLHLVSQLADRIAVMRGGVILEQGSSAEVFNRPRHPYTGELVAAVAKRRSAITVTPDASPLALSWQGIHRRYQGPDGTPTQALRDVSFQVRSGTTLGIVGQSGSGKSTLGRILMALETPDSGVVELFGQPWSSEREKARRPRRGAIQLIEQNPLDALDPRWTVRRIVEEALELDTSSDGTPGERLLETLGLVGLAPELLGRRPHQLSGGQRQRVAIARALARKPSVLILDEPVSALDAVVQAQILTLLGSLQRDLGLTLILISHDLGVIAHLSDEVLVLLEGEAIESGPLERILDNPSHAHTRALLEASRAL